MIFKTAGALVAVAVAIFFGIVFSVPEIEHSLFRGPLYYGQKEKVEFVPVAKGIWKLDFPWHYTPFHHEWLEMYLVNQGSNWAITDAGGPDTWLHKHATRLVEAANATMPPGARLTHVLLTHAHDDHVGAIQQLLDDLPDLKVIIHEGEKEFLTGKKNFTQSETPSLQLRVLIAMKLIPGEEYKMPADRAIFLRGSEGSMASIGFPDYTFYHTPGHSPGHCVFLHRPSGTLLAGDFADVLYDKKTGVTSLETVCSETCDISIAHASTCKIQNEIPFKMVLPYHDALKKGYSKAELKPLVEAYSKCGKS